MYFSAIVSAFKDIGEATWSIGATKTGSWSKRRNIWFGGILLPSNRFPGGWLGQKSLRD
jgi:hypothetical protein